MEDAEFCSIIDYALDGHDAQRELIDAFAALQERWVRFYPGYVSATIFASVGGDRVYNVVRWASEADYYRFEASSDTEGRAAAIEAAVASVSGRVEPRMTGAPRFRVARVVGPGPRTDAPPAAPDTRGDRRGGES